MFELVKFVEAQITAILERSQKKVTKRLEQRRAELKDEYHRRVEAEKKRLQEEYDDLKEEIGRRQHEIEAETRDKIQLLRERYQKVEQEVIDAIFTQIGLMETPGKPEKAGRGAAR